MTPERRSATRITEPLCYHGEGPVWSPSWGGLRWVDMLAGDLLTLRADGSVDRLHVGTGPWVEAASGTRAGGSWKPVAAFCRPRANGGYVVGLERGYGLAPGPDAAPDRVVALWNDPNLRMNEGGTDPWGRLYAGGMAYDRTPEASALVRIDADGSVRTVVDAVSTSNGIAFTADGSKAYYNDTGVKRVDVFDVVGGELVDRRPLHEAPILTHGERAGSPASPDGLCVDSAGNVWTAMNRLGEVHQISPEGKVLTVVELPVQLVTACTLGDEDLRTLYITTSRENLADPEPQAGAVFAVEVDVPGVPVTPYAG
ncbi:SMP-30/gluconolactonase/LRE family protein [Raineyella fluvialis]|uniref:SMP-30/gluconolactonase/LRE family protein n=1 Tax=Raineyella fluvialis TaxID=2662261 RepID=A0A5Q2F969_9ACTN|nr:SMP-30/gluconolactonase/LRE family protein [Raineyella fluvialis]QGF23228.1 SMP-30/gluconolactonase/LRE family protein [Raineyella fluvialis]